jgi:hypothetical protein
MSTAGDLLARMDKFDLTADLAAQVLTLTDDDILPVQRIDQARSLRVQLSGYEVPSSLSNEMVSRACERQNPEFDLTQSRPDKSIYDNRVLRESGASAHRKATYLVEAILDGVPSWIGCQVELTTASASGAGTTLSVRSSADWTAGGNPPLRQVQVALVPQEWQNIPFADFWTLLPESTSLQDARQMTLYDASTSIIVDAVGNLPATTPGTEATLGLLSADRIEIQHRLTLLGFDTRGADGIFGPGSRGAISDWQQRYGFEPTGFFDATQRDALFRESEAQYQAWLEEQRQIEAAEANQPARFDPPPAFFAPEPAPEPQGQPVRVCQRTIFGELVNCRIEFR